MDSFYIVTNKDKDPEFQTTRFVKEYLEKRGKKCTIRENSAEGGGSYKYTDASVIPEDVDCVLVLGGDGTLLQASRDLTERDLPLLGINMGTLGYLAEVDRRGIEPALERLLAGDYQLVSRMMIYGEVYHQGKKVMEDLALNDIVIGRYGRLRIIDFRSKTRTYDLRVMSPTSYQLLHPAILNMPEFLSVLYIIAENMHMSIPYLYYSQKMLIIHNFTG